MKLAAAISLLCLVLVAISIHGSAMFEDPPKFDARPEEDQSKFEAERKASLKPYEVVATICGSYGLDKHKVFSALGTGMMWEITARKKPLDAIYKAIHDIFYDDGCRVRYICAVGESMQYYKAHIPYHIKVLREDDELIDGLLDGIEGNDCGRPCPPKLSPLFNGYKEKRRRSSDL